MPSDERGPLVSTQWLAQHLNDPKLRLVDVRWRSRYENGRGISFDDYDGYRAGHIAGAVFAGMIEDLSDKEHAVPDMLAPPDAFERVMGRLGIDNETLVIAYDNMGIPLGSARLWWALSYYGHDRVKVLDGGLRQWRIEGRPLSSDPPTIRQTVFAAKRRGEWIADKADVARALDDPSTLIIDCLPQEQYGACAGESLWGARSGHIPGAVNVPFIANIDPELANSTSAARDRLLNERNSFVFCPERELAALYEKVGVTPEREVITYCGRGFAAAGGLLALKILGHERARLYDGSWSEWSNDPSLPVETGSGPKG